MDVVSVGDVWISEANMIKISSSFVDFHCCIYACCLWVEPNARFHDGRLPSSSNFLIPPIIGMDQSRKKLGKIRVSQTPITTTINHTYSYYIVINRTQTCYRYLSAFQF